MTFTELEGATFGISVQPFFLKIEMSVPYLEILIQILKNSLTSCRQTLARGVIRASIALRFNEEYQEKQRFMNN